MTSDVLAGLAILLSILAVIAAAIFLFIAVAKRSDKAAQRPFAVAALVSLGVFAVAFIFGLAAPGPALSSNPSGSPKPPQPIVTAQNSSIASESTGIKQFRENWTETISAIGYSVKASRRAAAELHTSNTIGASTELKHCSDTASGLTTDADDFADAHSDEATNLVEAISKVGDDLGYGCGSMRKYLDTSAPSDASDAVSQLQAAAGDIAKAQFLARERYKSLGGHSADLMTLTDALAN